MWGHVIGKAACYNSVAQGRFLVGNYQNWSLVSMYLGNIHEDALYMTGLAK